MVRPKFALGARCGDPASPSADPAGTLDVMSATPAAEAQGVPQGAREFQGSLEQ